MKLRLLTLSLSFALGGACLHAHAIGTLADVTVVDRDSGVTLPVHYARGEYWVAGRPGARYAVAVRSKAGERVLAVTAVDGVNVLSGDTAAWGQTGYVFSPYERYQITGWRKSSSEVAAFQFSDARDSYAGVTGRPGDVGVIGVALFRERQPEPVVQPQIQPRRHEPGMDQETRLRSAPAPAAAAAPPPMPAPAPSALADRRESAATEQSAGSGNLAKAAPSFAPPMPSPKLGTAHGQRETSVISHTRFDRLQSQPNEVIRIRYDSRENLVASGVIRKPVARQPVPNPFPESGNASYVPDPPVRQY
ncbi:MAG: hypothetical protein V4542_10000 [Pseudomonadota bacterium]